MAISSEVTKMKSGQSETTTYKVFAAQSADETISDAIDAYLAKGVTLIVETGAGVNGGVVELEGAVTADYAGTWIPLASVTTSAASKAYADSVVVEAGTAGLPMPFIRARISTVIGVGTINAYIVVSN